MNYLYVFVTLVLLSLVIVGGVATYHWCIGALLWKKILLCLGWAVFTFLMTGIWYALNFIVAMRGMH